ncbi:hypothetical protein [Sphingobacterium psychroaquaticum]|uniref:Uncharacterized protein n=1 Tax=Sphingobacterium psychroaquaticum TaxID=561061 RepID=A0A1X7JIR7_9SPHI|nr:hypothetical protein [Sphingobacterium psychroaquaticum]SMG27664.1 hypothetical protein SAMN05660862_1751 [Sphingobacterium psychroaquaticum]
MVKKIFIYTSITLAVLFTIGWGFYLVRKYQANKQFVSTQSTTILSVAVDDLLLDNVSSLLKKKKSQVSDTTSKRNWLKDFFWNSGLKIPSRLFFFSLPQEQDNLFAILSVSNYETCLSFFVNHYPKQIELIDKEKGLMAVKLHKYCHILFNKEFLALGVSTAEPELKQSLAALLDKPQSWQTAVSKATEIGFTFDKHVTLNRLDQTLAIGIDIRENKATITGNWLLSQQQPTKKMIRQLQPTTDVLTFWSTLPFEETPLLARISALALGNETASMKADYIDIQVSPQSTTQQDTIISYGYDDNFNSIETSEIRTLTVPKVSYTWRGTIKNKVQLPSKFFYNFYRTEVDNYEINSTSRDSEQQQFISTESPIFLAVDFGRWPNSWSMGLFETWKASRLKVHIDSRIKEGRTLTINGHASIAD